jgi:hypothetical protein
VISVSDIVSDPDLAQPFQIQRSTGQFVQGGWQDTLSIVQAYGTITVADAKVLDMLPEGDRPVGAMSFYSTFAIFETRALTPTYGSGPAPGYGHGAYGGSQGVSDVIVWRNNPYRIIKVFEWVDWGFHHGVGTRMTGA